MTRNYEQLWKGITDKTDKTEAAEGLAKIVADNAGRDFILGSEYEEAELCVEILDHVSHNTHSPPLPPSQMVSPGHHKTQPRTRREKYFPCYVEETCPVPQAAAPSHENDRRDCGFARCTHTEWTRRDPNV